MIICSKMVPSLFSIFFKLLEHLGPSSKSLWAAIELAKVLTHLSPSYQRAWLRLFDSLAVDPYNDQPKEGSPGSWR